MPRHPALLPQMAAQGTALTPTLAVITAGVGEVRQRPDGPRKDWYLRGAAAHGRLAAEPLRPESPSWPEQTPPPRVSATCAPAAFSPSGTAIPSRRWKSKLAAMSLTTRLTICRSGALSLAHRNLREIRSAPPVMCLLTPRPLPRRRARRQWRDPRKALVRAALMAASPLHPPLRPRSGQPRSRHLLGHDHLHDPPPRPPAEVQTST